MSIDKDWKIILPTNESYKIRNYSQNSMTQYTERNALYTLLRNSLANALNIHNLGYLTLLKWSIIYSVWVTLSFNNCWEIAVISMCKYWQIRHSLQTINNSQRPRRTCNQILLACIEDMHTLSPTCMCNLLLPSIFNDITV